MIKEHDRIVLKKSLAGQGLKAGDVSTVIHVYKAGEAFEVISDTSPRNSCRCDLGRFAGSSGAKKRNHSRALASRLQRVFLEPVKLFDKKDAPLDWEYDSDADSLYISFGKPKP